MSDNIQSHDPVLETNVNIKLQFGMLRKQKQRLLQIMDKCNMQETEDLQGILHIIDHIQDDASRQFSENIVFGK